jgi:hypothetical protein
MSTRQQLWTAALVTTLALGSVGASRCTAGFVIGPDASNYLLIYAGGAGKALQMTNVTANGNIGVANTGTASTSGTTVTGRLDFAGANTGQYANTNGNPPAGGVNYGVGAVATAFSTVRSLNSVLGAEGGTNLVINGSTTINGSAGMLDASGNRVFTVSSFNTTNSDVITVNGNGSNIVVNFTGSANFDATVVLNGITSSQLLWNFVGGSNLSGGPTLSLNNNASGPGHANLFADGTFLDPNGAISIVNSNIRGHVFGGDSQNEEFVSGANFQAPTAIPEPASILLFGLGGFGLAGLVALRRRAN